jgi:hypothetical protein
MSAIATAIVGGAVIGGTAAYLGQKEAGSSAEKAQTRGANIAAEAELEATEMSIEEQRRQFDEIRTLLQPYVSAGETSLTQMLNLTGMGGDQAQRAAIAGLEGSPQFEALTKSGEEAILQNASATGGLRGGNIQSALAEFRPSILSQLIENQYSKLRDITGIGQASAAGVGAAGQATAGNISNLMQSMGASQAARAMNVGNAQAQNALLQGQAFSNAISGITGSIPLGIYAAKKF